MQQIIEETQLRFVGHEGPIDCVRQLDDESFVSGSQDGFVCLCCLCLKMIESPIESPLPKGGGGGEEEAIAVYLHRLPFCSSSLVACWCYTCVILLWSGLLLCGTPPNKTPSTWRRELIKEGGYPP